MGLHLPFTSDLLQLTVNYLSVIDQCSSFMSLTAFLKLAQVYGIPSNKWIHHRSSLIDGKLRPALRRMQTGACVKKKIHEWMPTPWRVWGIDKVRIIVILDGRFDDCTPEVMQHEDRVDNYHETPSTVVLIVPLHLKKKTLLSHSFCYFLPAVIITPSGMELEWSVDGRRSREGR